MNDVEAFLILCSSPVFGLLKTESVRNNLSNFLLYN